MPTEQHHPELPWAPIYTTLRSHIPEISVQGIVYIWAEDRKLFANAGRSLLKIGNTEAPLWSRSLLKPFQLMVLYPTLKAAYPQLSDAHFALMSASHSGDPEQIELLQDMLHIGNLQPSDLQCPACRSMNGRSSSDKSTLNHPCAGKHLAHLLYQKAKQQPLQSYLSSHIEPYQRLRQLLQYLLGKTTLAETVDGCGMPNYEMNAIEAAQLYHALVMPVGPDLMRQAPDELTDILGGWDEISELIRNNPMLIGGKNRLDTRLMSEFQALNIKLIAKEGADGLLAVGLGPSPKFSDGLGIFIKVASGYEPQQLELILQTLLAQLGLIPPRHQEAGILETHFQFDVSGVSVST
ncbi:asparaginase [Vampirovibrio sp.]|uniref:asparaginase n=1 Tax=Vampirovibrio sp. TaxID=2717857 RepID=UPI0035934182